MHSKHQTIKEPAETTSRPVTQQQRVPINNPRLDHNRQTYHEEGAGRHVHGFPKALG
jgi:hypothetical protein